MARWKVPFRASSAAPTPPLNSTSASTNTLEKDGEQQGQKRTKWSLGILNHPDTDEVPGSPHPFPLQYQYTLFSNQSLPQAPSSSSPTSPNATNRSASATPQPAHPPPRSPRPTHPSSADRPRHTRRTARRSAARRSAPRTGRSSSSRSRTTAPTTRSTGRRSAAMPPCSRWASTAWSAAA